MNMDEYKAKICKMIENIQGEALLKKIYITIKIWVGD